MKIYIRKVHLDILPWSHNTIRNRIDRCTCPNAFHWLLNSLWQTCIHLQHPTYALHTADAWYFCPFELQIKIRFKIKKKLWDDVFENNFSLKRLDQAWLCVSRLNKVESWVFIWFIHGKHEYKKANRSTKCLRARNSCITVHKQTLHRYSSVILALFKPVWANDMVNIHNTNTVQINSWNKISISNKATVKKRRFFSEWS